MMYSRLHKKYYAKRVFLSVVFLVVTAHLSSGENIEEQPGYLKSELIFPLDDKPTPNCHASTIVANKERELVTSWFGGTEEGNPDVDIWVSRYAGGKWSKPVEAANGEWVLGRRFPCWNPVLFQPRNGPLLLFFKTGPTPSTWWGEWMISEDGGKTWKERQCLPKGGIGPVKNKPIQLQDGTILCPSSSEHDGWRVHFERTADLGKTWEIIGPLPADQEFQVIQPCILTYPDGRMQVLCRTKNKKVIAQSWSQDGGTTWSPVAATELPNPNSGIDAVTLSDGRQLVVYNPITKGRNILSVAISADGAKWKEVMKLEEETDGEFSYPAVIQTADDRVHITYTYNRVSIKHVVIDPKIF